MVTQDQGCEYWQGLLAAEAVGQIDEADRSSLHLHLVDCRHCRTVRTELAEVAAALALVDDSALDDPTVPVPTESDRPCGPLALDHTVLSMLAAPDPDRLRRSRRARRVWAGLAVAAAVLVVVGTLGLLHHPSPALGPWPCTVRAAATGLPSGPRGVGDGHRAHRLRCGSERDPHRLDAD